MRIEVFGCSYHAQTIYFNGKSLLHKSLSENPVVSQSETIKFSFKTVKETGIILYSQGSQGDYLALQLVENRFVTFFLHNQTGKRKGKA